jgi:hypothetical protein
MDSIALTDRGNEQADDWNSPEYNNNQQNSVDEKD